MATADRLLVIDDDERMRDSLREALVRRGYEVRTAEDGPDGLERCREQSFAAILCDLKMPEMTGIEVCRRLKEMGYPAPIVVITAFGSVETAVEAMREGAFDYITKPFKGDEVQVVVEKALGHGRLLRENLNLRSVNQALRSEVERRSDSSQMVGESDKMQELTQLVERYAASPATVLIRGQSGVGKEVVARFIHSRSERRERPFVCVNCAALSAGLLESELFGHIKGAFTGAESTRQGRFEIAEGGTLLLDEVSEIDPGLQAKLLRVLQEKSFERVGSSKPIKADVRVLATSNRNLEDEVRKGRFREDLFFRLNVLPIEIPSLAERKSDIPLLVEHFLEKIHRRTGGAAKRLDSDAGRVLQDYHWPGNVRELENVIERAWVLTDGDVIHVGALGGIAASQTTASSVASGASESRLESFRGQSLRTVERVLIEDALRRHGGHQKRTAEELGIGVRTLRTKIKKWNLKGSSTNADDLDDEFSEESEHDEALAEVTT